MTKPLKITLAHEPAFPTAGVGAYVGITVREYFASLAMQGLLANPNLVLNGKATPDNISIDAFRVADAMLARAKE
jgi:hypothetical protein